GDLLLQRDQANLFAGEPFRVAARAAVLGERRFDVSDTSPQDALDAAPCGVHLAGGGVFTGAEGGPMAGDDRDQVAAHSTSPCWASGNRGESSPRPRSNTDCRRACASRASSSRASASSAAS